jgi:pimeloyl-ACP methyl ester carboxylesterase
MTPHAITTPLVRPDAPALVVHDWGGDGPPVLLCHPTGFHGLVWRPIATRLVAAGKRVWSFDFHGHGDSEPADPSLGAGGYGWDSYGRDVAAVADHLGLAGDPELVAVGHSKGATAILLADEQDPGTFPRAWCFEPVMIRSDELLPPDHDFPLAVNARKRRAVWSSPDEAYASYAGRPPLDALDPDALHAYVDGGLRQRDDGSWELKCAPEAEAATYAHGVAHGLWTRLGDLTARIHVVCGETTDAIGPAFAERIVERLPHGSLEVMSGVGHFGPIEAPVRAVASILAFDEQTRPDTDRIGA